MTKPSKLFTGIASALALSASISAWADEQDFSSMQMQGVEKVDIQVDVEGAAQRLSQAVQFQTISNQDRSDFDEQAFRDYHQFLEESYPLVHKTLKREEVGDPRPFSLIYTWEGKDPSLAPAIFMAHQDVVPIAVESRDEWKEDPFSGAIKDGY
ncbi:peptidase M20, partial [Vibrio alginolyticus]